MNRLDDLFGRRVLVWGARLEGRSVVRFLDGRSPCRVVVDPPADYSALSDETGATVEPPSDDVLGWCEAIVRSPIIHPDRAELAAAREAGKVVGHPVGLWLAQPRPQPVIGLTGTKGKSTTSALTAAILRAAGLDVGLGGNIEIPITDLRDDHDAYVVEVSSYMATDAPASPRFGLLTNLGEDHVTWHGSLDRYRSDKLRLFGFGQLERLAVNGFDEVSLALTRHLPQVRFGTDGFVLDGLAVRFGGETVVDTADTYLGNPHFALDVCGALTAAGFVIGDERAAAIAAPAVLAHEPLPSRLEPAGSIGGIRFVDDALASNPLGAVAGVGAFPDVPLAIIVGGENRDVGFEPLLDALAGRRAPTFVALVSDTTELLAAGLADRGVAHVAIGDQDIAPAVVAAHHWAATHPRAVVLFSPGAPTPRWFGYHSDRSRTFKAAVAALRSAGPDRVSRAGW